MARDFSYKVRVDGTGITRREALRGQWFYGPVLTPQGIVMVSYETYSERLRMDFIHAGRWYIREQRQEITRRGLTTMAARFAREVVEETP